MRKALLHIVGLLVTCSTLITCSQNDLFLTDAAQLKNTTPIDRDLLRNLEGIYTLADGASALGDEFVCKTSRNKVSFFSNSRGIFFIMDAGFNASDSSIRFAGFWRVSENVSSGAIAFKIPVDSGAREILKGLPSPALKMNGLFTSGQSLVKFRLGYDRDFSPAVKARPFAIFGHHGIQTNANPPFSENSLEAFRQAQDYGANGLEVDVRLTKDHVPVLFHDPDLNIRVLQKNGILANLDEVNFNLLEAAVRLLDGQRIPRLDSALRLAIDSTELEYVWLDIKGNDNVFAYLEPVIRDAVAHAQTKGRSIEIITDIPSEEVLSEFRKQPTFTGLPLMYEPDIETTLAIGAGYWGPRWTLGTLNSDVARAHQEGVKVFTWTLNDEGTIVSFLNNGDFDGLITDYPAYAVYHYYTR